MLWFTADTHFGHANVIKHSARPYRDTDHMDVALLANINLNVMPHDTLYHLGDFAFRGKGPSHYRPLINCRNVILITGNHDPHDKRSQPHKSLWDLFQDVYTLLKIKVPDPLTGLNQHIIMCHYAMRVWNSSHHGAWHLHGHSHGTLKPDPHALSMDVGVDPNRYCPVNLDMIARHMALKDFRPIDHHVPRTTETQP